MGRYLAWLERGARPPVRRATRPRGAGRSRTRARSGSRSGTTSGSGPRRRPGPPSPNASMPGARWFPGARLNYAEHALALPGRAGSDVVVVGHSQTRDPVELTADELRDAVARCRAGLQALGVRPRGPGRGLPAQHPRDARGVPRHGVAGRDLVLVRAGVRDAGRGGPVRADRARRAADDRRIPVRRPRARPRGRGGRDPRRAAVASGRRSSSPTCAGAARGRGGDPGRGGLVVAARGRRHRWRSTTFPSTTRCTSSSRPAPPGFRRRSSTGTAGSSSSTRRRSRCTRISGRATASAGSRRPAG